MGPQQGHTSLVMGKSPHAHLTESADNMAEGQASFV